MKLLEFPFGGHSFSLSPRWKWLSSPLCARHQRKFDSQAWGWRVLYHLWRVRLSVGRTSGVWDVASDVSHTRQTHFCRSHCKDSAMCSPCTPPKWTMCLMHFKGIFFLLIPQPNNTLRQQSHHPFNVCTTPTVDWNPGNLFNAYLHLGWYPVIETGWLNCLVFDGDLWYWECGWADGRRWWERPLMFLRFTAIKRGGLYLFSPLLNLSCLQQSLWSELGWFKDFVSERSAVHMVKYLFWHVLWYMAKGRSTWRL